MIVDANVLLYAADRDSQFHADAEIWLREAFNAEHHRVGLPWQTLGAFYRIATHPRASASPLTPERAHEFVSTWLSQPAAWIPSASKRTVKIYAQFATKHHITGNLVPDTQLAPLAFEYGVPVVSFDGDFARFQEIRWINPLGSAQD